MVRVALERELLETCTVAEAVGLVFTELAEHGLAGLADHGYAACGLALPRPQEVFACVNRLRV